MGIKEGTLDKDPETWCILSLLGHKTYAGRLSEEEKFGCKLGRLDIPTTGPCSCANGSKLLDMPTVPCELCNGSGFVTTWQTKYFGGASVYEIAIVSESVARHAARQTAPAPVSPWDFPKPALPAPAYKHHDDDDDDLLDRGDEPSDLEP